jgi:hypothetical protein
VVRWNAWLPALSCDIAEQCFGGRAASTNPDDDILGVTPQLQRFGGYVFSFGTTGKWLRGREPRVRCSARVCFLVLVSICASPGFAGWIKRGHDWMVGCCSTLRLPVHCGVPVTELRWLRVAMAREQFRGEVSAWCCAIARASLGRRVGLAGSLTAGPGFNALDLLCVQVRNVVLTGTDGLQSVGTSLSVRLS